MSRRPVFLLGFMGCGKSTIGPRLAREFSCRFVDLDDEVERRTERTIAVLFNELGESGFREVETLELRRAAEMRDVIVACGGGIISVAENRAILTEKGLSIYLKVAPRELARRLGTSTHRPMLYGDDGERLGPKALSERIQRLLSEREPFYQKADVVLDVTKKTVDQVVKALVKAIGSDSSMTSQKSST